MIDLLDQIALPGAAEIVDVSDPLELDTTSTMTRRLASNMQTYRYKLLDRTLLRQSFEQPISRHLTRDLGHVLVCNVGDRFATQLDIHGDGVDAYCFNRMITGCQTVMQNGCEATSRGAMGFAARARGGTRSMASDWNGRANVWVNAGFLERVLGHLIGDRVRRPLDFRLGVAWESGLPSSVAGLFRYLTAELGRPDGLATSPIALASFYDLLARAVLLGLPNSYSDRLSNGGDGAVPAYVARSEAFMRAHAADPVSMEDVAAASGCSVRTLEAVFRRFRDTTPLAALRAVRLDRVRAELTANPASRPTGDVARRYGFTNAGRFRRAYEQRFGESPPKMAIRTQQQG